LITEYAPKIFHHIRQLDGINADLIKSSLNPTANRKSVFKAGESQGKSGSFFFFSADRNFIIKTMNEGELKILLKMLKEYHMHLWKNQTNSLMSRIYGVYEIKMKSITSVHVILMQNSMQFRSSMIERIFDLKGSLINREVKKKVLAPTAVLKDLNFLAISREENIIRLTEDDRLTIVSTLNEDSALLNVAQIMDYSLLLGIEKNPFFENQSRFPSVKSDIMQASPSSRKLIEEARAAFTKTRNTFISSNGRFIYHISIIDYLQFFDLSKRMENYFKRLKNKQGAEISAIHPNPYAIRFVNFMGLKVFPTQGRGATLVRMSTAGNHSPQ